MATKYLTIYRNEDEPRMEMLNEAQLKVNLKEDWSNYDFLDHLPNFMSFPSRSVFIFKGETVIPQPVQQVTEWKI
jgi:hypothetical protein